MKQRRLMAQTDVYLLPHIPYLEFRRKILNLNPKVRFEEMVAFGRPVGKMKIIVPEPPKTKIETYEKLTHWEKRYCDASRGAEGPAREVVSVSMGHISPFVTLVSQRQAAKPTEVIAWSLKTIIKRLVEAKAFTWSDAEKEFQISFRNFETRIEEVEGVIPKWWEADGEESRKLVVPGA